jgi:hypothetical protein
MRPLLIAFAALCGAACTSAAVAPRPDATPGILTYWQDIAPIINDRCVACHQAGGVAPFPLDGYQTVKLMAPTIAQVTKIGYMPPYYVTHDGSCGQFDDHEALTADQIARLDAWAGGDRPEGTPVPLTRPPIPGVTDGDVYQTPATAPRPPGGKLGASDEIRCFPFASKRTADGFITAYDIRPGNEALVTDVAVFLVDPARRTRDGRSNAQVMKALDDGDPAAGWPCIAQAGEGVEVDAIAAVWAPGTGPVSFPGNSGVRHPRADQLVIQVHYNLADPRLAGMTDTTTVRLRTAAVARPAALVVQDPFLDTLARPQPDVLPPGQPETTYRWTRTAAALGIPAGATLLGVMPHMHARGVRQELAVGMPPRCAARVEQWSSGWQRLYLYRTPATTTLGADAEIQMSCTYNTMTDADPVPPGLGLDGELCTAVLMLALPTA